MEIFDGLFVPISGAITKFIVDLIKRAPWIPVNGGTAARTTAGVLSAISVILLNWADGNLAHPDNVKYIEMVVQWALSWGWSHIQYQLQSKPQ